MAINVARAEIRSMLFFIAVICLFVFLVPGVGIILPEAVFKIDRILVVLEIRLNRPLKTGKNAPPLSLKLPPQKDVKLLSGNGSMKI